VHRPGRARPRHAQRLGQQARITLVSDRDDFLFKPNTIYIPFGADPAEIPGLGESRQKIRQLVELAFTTYERTFIQAFGPKLHDVVLAEFAERGIEGHTAERLALVDAERATYESGLAKPYDLLIALPPYVAAVRYPELAADERGFLETDLGSRLVEGQERISAPGDAGDFPVKQAFSPSSRPTPSPTRSRRRSSACGGRRRSTR
jgi:NADH dehydrogenase FAD-containing subunit